MVADAGRSRAPFLGFGQQQTPLDFSQLGNSVSEGEVMSGEIDQDVFKGKRSNGRSFICSLPANDPPAITGFTQLLNQNNVILAWKHQQS